MLRPNIEEDFARALDTYAWAAAQVEKMGGEAARLRPRAVIAYFKQWTARELDLRREAASASELRENLVAESGFYVPAIDWTRTSRRVLTLEWIDGIKLTDRDALVEAGHDLKALAAILVRAFLRQSVIDGFFHADLHQGNLFALPDGRLAAIDFGIMGRIDRQARVWLAEILYGLLTGNYRRVAEIHFEAQYVPAHHDVDEFATALRAVGEPIRGLPVKDISIGQMLDGLFTITRDFEMPTQPHLLLLQKTMVMEEGVAHALDPDINMWETAEPFLREWVRGELGPEAALADRIVRDFRTFAKIPELIRRIDHYYPPPGAAPPDPPLAEVVVVKPRRYWRYVATAAAFGGGGRGGDSAPAMTSAGASGCARYPGISTAGRSPRSIRDWTGSPAKIGWPSASPSKAAAAPGAFPRRTATMTAASSSSAGRRIISRPGRSATSSRPRSRTISTSTAGSWARR